MKLKIVMEDFSGTVKEAYYNDFRIENQVHRDHPYITLACFCPFWTPPTHLISKHQHFFIATLNLDVFF